jgi:hypothetical protein
MMFISGTNSRRLADDDRPEVALRRWPPPDGQLVSSARHWTTAADTADLAQGTWAILLDLETSYEETCPHPQDPVRRAGENGVPIRNKSPIDLHNSATLRAMWALARRNSAKH